MSFRSGRLLRVEPLESRRLLSAVAIPGGTLPAARTIGLPHVSAAMAAAFAAPVSTKIQISSSPTSTVDFGQTLTLLALVTSKYGTPTGYFQFQVDGAPTGPLFTLAAGSASLALNGLSVGQHDILGYYTSDNATFLNAQTLAPLSVIVQSAKTTIGLSASPAKGIVLGQTLTLRALLSAKTGTPAGAVQFVVDGVNYGSPVPLAAGMATTTVTGLTIGTHLFTGLYTSNSAAFSNCQSGSPLNVPVTAAVLTITVKPQVNVYGSKMPTLTPSFSGFINNDTAAVLTSQPTITTTADRTSHVGTYPITVTGGSSPNYVVNDVNSTLTVLPAPLTITADNKIMVAGAAMPPLTAGYSGFVNGDTAARLAAPPKLSTTATAASPPGVYPIVAASAAAADYQITYVAGTLTIVDASLSTNLVPDPIVPGKSTLVVRGTPGNDVIDIRPGGANQIVVQFLGPLSFQRTFDVGQIAHVCVYGGAGNDGLWIEPGVTIPAVLFGGDGNNSLLGGSGPAVLVGGSGGNTLRAGTGPTILIAGSGAAHLYGGSGSDVLVGGSTDFDNDLAALDTILAEWGNSLTGYHNRVSHLLGPTPGLNGSYFLNTTTVHAGSAATTFGGANNDWFLMSPSQAANAVNYVPPQDVVTVIG